MVHDGGAGFTPPPQLVVIEQPSPTVPNEIVQTTVPVEEAVAIASQSVQTIRVGTPSEGFPATAVSGKLYEFSSQPGVLYWLGPDNVWRGLPGMAV
jgi:hypothetical protein